MTMKRIYTLLALSAIAAVSCTEPVIHDNDEGMNPGTKGSYTALLAERAAGRVISMTLTSGGPASVSGADFYLRSSLPFEKSGTVWLGFADRDFVKEYSEATGTGYALLPAAYYRFSDGNSIEVSAGSMESARNHLTVSTKDMFGNVIAPGRYLLPVVGDGTGVCGLDEGTILIDLTVREPYTDPDGYPFINPDELLSVCYLSTSSYDPRLANDMFLNVYKWATHESKSYGMAHIVNLMTSTVAYDELTGKVSVAPGNDLRYVLGHYTGRVLPVQESGRKVCICIEGGGKGVGFCNFTDEQIADFTASVKRLVQTYGLDGINLWDRNTGYGREGTPPMNTTSYPKLIKALRQALGTQKLLTVTDYREQTEYFGDLQKTGGIAVGEYIDYAWHGYFDNSEPLQVVDPWNQNLDVVSSAYPRKPIAGLDRSRYGCIHDTPRRLANGTYDNALKWCNDGYFNGIAVYYDIRSIVQDRYESSPNHPAMTVGHIFTDTVANMGIFLQADGDRITNYNGTGSSMQYDKWKKDW